MGGVPHGTPPCCHVQPLGATAEELARRAQRTVDLADWASRRLDELAPARAQREVREAQRVLEDITAEMKPLTLDENGEKILDPFKLVEAPGWTGEHQYGIMQASGKLGDTDGYSRITSTRSIPANDHQTVRRELNDFGSKYQSSDTEHSLVISPGGEVFEVSGLSGVVNTELVGADALEGSTVIHNHPIWEGHNKGDSFSEGDLIFAVKNRAGLQFLISGSRSDAFIYTGNLGEDQIRAAYKAAKQEVFQRAIDTDTPVEYEQEEIMRVLNKYLEGFEFYEDLQF